MRWPFVHIAGVSLAAMAIATVCTAIAVVRNGRDISSLICTSTSRAGHGAYRAVTWGAEGGYDGQFYYVIAQNPWRLHTDDGIDHPAARHLRVLYPAVCWLCSGGDPELLLWVMPAVNLLGIGALAGLGAYLALHCRRSPWWGVTLPLVIHMLLPMLRDLTDGMSTLFVCALLACWLLQSGPGLLGVCAAAALLCREQNLLVVGVMGLAALYRWDRRAVLALMVAVLVWTGWVAAIWIGYGTRPFLGAAGNFGLPLAGLLNRWQHPTGELPSNWRVEVLNFIGLLHMTALIAIGTWLVCRPGCPCSRVLRLTLLLGLALAVVGGPAIYCDMWSFPRVFVAVPLGIWLLGLQTGGRWQLACLLPGFAVSFAAFMRCI